MGETAAIRGSESTSCRGWEDIPAVADALLYTLACGRADGLVVIADVGGGAAGSIAFERCLRPVQRLEVSAELAYGVIARLALCLGSDLVMDGPQSGYLMVSPDGHRTAEIRGRLFKHDGNWRLELLASMDAEHGDSEGDWGLTGHRVGPYQVVDWLGSGGNAHVYRVRHVALGKDFALKVMRSDRGHVDAYDTSTLLAEAKACARISHPHVVSPVDFGSLYDGRPYFVMDLIDGPLFMDLLDLGPQPVVWSLRVIASAASTLHAVHEQGFVHDDVSAHNIQFAGDARPETLRIIDFGTAFAYRDSTDAESSDMIVGTVHYMSPEKARGKNVGPASDIYALGVMLFCALVGDAPFTGDDPVVVLKKHINAPVPDVESHGVPAACGDIVRKAMAKSPEDRYSNAADLAQACTELADALSKPKKGWWK